MFALSKKLYEGKQIDHKFDDQFPIKTRFFYLAIVRKLWKNQFITPTIHV